MVNRAQGRAGYTLTEMLMVVAIIGILATVGSRVMLQINRYFILTNTRADLQREARAAMYVINRNLRQGSIGSITIDRAASQPYYSRLTFTKITGSKMIFYQSGTSLVQLVGTKTRTLTSNVKYLAFTFPRSDDLSVISVSITLEKAIYQGRVKALHMASEKVRVMND
ncbi:MAG: type II secretion system protein [Elusimicrobia bacterium]|nr:type II secretion system protein [Elusimicrobiota bacterium]